MKDHPNPNVQAVSEPHSGANDLDPSPVDTETPDVNPDQPDQCQVVEATTRDGQPLTFAVHTLAPLTSVEQAMLGQVAQAAAERMARENPHGGVLTELMLASVHAQVVLRDAGKAQRADRLSTAVRAACDVIRAASRFHWADDLAEVERERDSLRAELAAERLAHAGTQGERDAADDFAALVRVWLDVPDEPGWANAVRQQIAELRADAAASETTLDHVHTSLIEHLDVADELSLPDVLAAVGSRVDERDAGRLVLEEQVRKQGEEIARLRAGVCAEHGLTDAEHRIGPNTFGGCNG